MKRFFYSPAILLIVILLIASFLRLYKINELPPGFYPDEAMYANNGVEAWETGNFKVFYPENFGREGLWPNIIGFFIIRFGNQPWAPRSAAAIFGTLTVLGLYFLTKELFNENSDSDDRNAKTLKISHGEQIALLAAFFLATSFWHINFSRIAFRAIMAPFFLVWGIYFLLLFLNKIGNCSDIKEKIKNQISNAKNTNQKLKIILFSILGGIFYGLGFHTYIAYRATPLLVFAILLFFLLKNKDKAIRKRITFATGYFLLATFIVALPLGIYFLKNPQDFFGRTGQISILNSLTPFKDLSVNIVKTLGMFNFWGDNNWRHDIANRPLLFWPVGALFVIGFILAFNQCLKIFNFQFSIFKKNQNPSLKNNINNTPPQTETKIHFVSQLANYILIFWLVIAALPVIISNEGLPHALRAILMAPPVFILAAAGGVWLYEQTAKYKFFAKTRIKNLFRVFCVVFLSLLIFEAYTTYFVRWGKNPNVAGSFSQNYVEIGKQLNALPKELPKYVIVKANGVLVNGIPMPAQTVMFITDTYTAEKQKDKNIFYILPSQTEQIPLGSYTTILE